MDVSIKDEALGGQGKWNVEGEGTRIFGSSSRHRGSNDAHPVSFKLLFSSAQASRPPPNANDARKNVELGCSLTSSPPLPLHLLSLNRYSDHRSVLVHRSRSAPRYPNSTAHLWRSLTVANRNKKLNYRYFQLLVVRRVIGTLA